MVDLEITVLQTIQQCQIRLVMPHYNVMNSYVTLIGMYKTLERYRSCNFNSEATATPETEQSNYQEYLKLKTRVEFLQTTQRNHLGEDLGPLNMKELEQLENQIEISLKHIRATKSQQSLDQLFELKRKEQQLQDVNKDLRKKIQETSVENVLQMSCQDVGPSGSSGHANQANQQEYFHHDCDPSLHIGNTVLYLNKIANM
ncbi:unnamed protein product [Triticum turgidum subsp. durum]|uniref:K-box domain-containing protein n=1 Tax=Triticum turgidum subsp. durum TaxID=4567 RepID=A0A9R1BJA2_TRITD|nr:unnamed protein product [Triticum turgidum subsp. durum]